MTEFTVDYLNALLERHTDNEIHATAVFLKDQLAVLEHEVCPEKKLALTETVQDYSALLEHLLREGGRGGEDYINDGVFHAMG
jgi:hypothetical protein